MIAAGAPVSALTEIADHWVAWRLEPRGKNGKPTKVPYAPGPRFKMAETDNPATWASYDLACTMAGCDGQGLVLTGLVEIAALDLDGCRDPVTGTLAPWAVALCERAQSYTEVTPSGTGVRILGVAPGAPKTSLTLARGEGQQIEVYAGGATRYVTVSFQRLEDYPDALADISPVVRALLTEAEAGKSARPTSADLPRTPRTDAAAILTAIPNRYDRAGWIRLGLAYKAAGGDYEGFDAWSRQHASYDANETLRVWESLKPNGAISAGSLVFEARAHGIDVPRPHATGAAMNDQDGEAARARKYAPKNSDYGADPWPDEEQRWREEDGQREKEKAKDIQVYWHGDPAADEEEMDPLIADLLPRVGKGLMSGQWGLYKTFIAVDAAGAVMWGGSFAGKPVRRQGGVLFIAAEGSRQIRRRLKALIKGKLADADAADPPDGFVPVDIDNLPFAWIKECPPLLREGAVDALMPLIQAVDAAMRLKFGFGLALVVIDTVAAASGMQNEDDAAEAQRLFNGLEQIAETIQACVVGVDHFGKTVEVGTRGSSAKESAADFVLALLGDRSLSGEIKNARMTVRKMRDGETGAEFPFSLTTVELGTDKWGEPITSGLIAWEKQEEKKSRTSQPPPKSLRGLLKALDVALTEHGVRLYPYGTEGDETLVVDKEHVREEFNRSCPAPQSDTPKQQADAKRQQWNRALKAASQDEVILSREIGRIDYLWKNPTR